MEPTKPCYGAEGWGQAGTRFDYDGELTFAQYYMSTWKSGKNVDAFGMCQWYMAESPGESGLGRNFACSMMDGNRIPKMLYKIYAACWFPYSVRPIVYLANHWNRSGAVTVNAFSNCPTVRSLVNGVAQGADQTPYPDSGNGTALLAHQCSWNVTWQSGTVTAQGLDANGNVVCSDRKVTAGNPDHILLTVAAPIVNPATGDSFRITANGADAAFILATVVDAHDNWCPTGKPQCHLQRFGARKLPRRGGPDDRPRRRELPFARRPRTHGRRRHVQSGCPVDIHARRRKRHGDFGRTEPGNNLVYRVSGSNAAPGVRSRHGSSGGAHRRGLAAHRNGPRDHTVFCQSRRDSVPGHT